eukprot:15348026-Ditylum_brightwellii.AAC.1
MMTEMHSVLMGNNAVGVPYTSKDIDSGKEAILVEGEKEPSNAFSVMMIGQKRAPSFAHLIVSSNGGITDTSKKQDNFCARMSWKALLQVANEEERKYLTFAVAVPSPSGPQYGNFQST